MRAVDLIVHIFEVSTLALGALLAVWLFWKVDRFEGLVLLMAMVLGFLIEYLGIKFGLHYYSEDFQFVLGEYPEGIPYVIGVGWALVFFTTRSLSARLNLPWWLAPSAAALLALLLDLFLDPMVARSVMLEAQAGVVPLTACVNAMPDGNSFGVGLWTWCLKPEIEAWMGVPLANYLGWFVIVWTYALLLRFTIRWYNIKTMSLVAQLVMLAIIVGISVAFISCILLIFLWLSTIGISNAVVLALLGLSGVIAIIASGRKRQKWGFELIVISLLMLDTVICWYAYLGGYFSADPGVENLLYLAAFNITAFATAFWIMIPPRSWSSIDEGPFAIQPGFDISDEKLLDWRKVADVPADAVIQQLYTSDADIQKVNHLLSQLLKGHDPDLFENLPDEVAEFIRKESQVDDNIDQKRIRNGQRLFLEYSGVGAAALAVASLPECYALKTSGDVIGRTNRLKGPSAFKRIVETAQFLIYIVEENGLKTPENGSRQGKGIKAILRVRLMHAAIRWLINRDSSEDPVTSNTDYAQMIWDASNDVPINQLELAHTLMTFCWVTIRSIRETGAAFTLEQANDYVYMWRLAGRHLGIHNDLLPSNVDEAAGLFEQIKNLGKGRSDSGAVLTQSALDVLARMLEKKINVWPFVARAIARVFMAEWVDGETRTILGVKPLTFWEELIFRPLINIGFYVMAWIDRRTDKNWALGYKSRIGMVLLKYYADHPDELGTDTFELPEELAPP